MSDPTPGAAGLPEPELPESDTTVSGDETVRVPVEPEVAWSVPEPPVPPRAMPWEAPSETPQPSAPTPTAPMPTALPLLPPDGSGDASPAEGAWTPPPPVGVLSAATVGWVAPPPEPVATGSPGWVVASTGIRLAAWLVDGIVSGVVIGAVLGLTVALVPDLVNRGAAIYMAYTVAATGFYFLYFVGFWTSNGKATPGMRVFKLQVANAADGKRLAIGPAVVRWLALGYIFSLIGLFEPLAGIAGLVALVWYIALLATTANDPMHQGLHDRWAKSVVVRPEGAGSGASRGLMACLIVVAVVAVLFVLLMVGIVVMAVARYG